uniref:hypothetical protein n=1 Tax=Stieleria mannarensis TaxID=2755585 RepID=UPI001C71F33C
YWNDRIYWGSGVSQKQAIKAALFGLALILLIAGAIRFMREGGFASAIGWMGAVGGALALIIERLTEVEGIPSRRRLKSRNKDELRLELKETFGVVPAEHQSKNELVRLLHDEYDRRKGRTKLWVRLKWLAIFAAVPVAFLLHLIGKTIYPIPQESLPEIEFGWYQYTESGLVLEEPDSLKIAVNDTDILNNEVRIPIQIALRRNDPWPLEVVRVELGYPKGMKVSPGGKARIDENESLILYEHSIGTLSEVDTYTPLERVDVVTIPFKFITDRTIVQTSEGIPHMTTWILGIEGFVDSKPIRFRVRVFCKNRPPIYGLVNIGLAGKFQFFTDVDEMAEIREGDELSEADRMLFVDEFAGAHEEDQWSQAVNPSGDMIRYRKLTTGDAVLQVLDVNDQRRKLNVDGDADGGVDFTLADSTGDGRADLKFVSTRYWPMVDWSENAAK